MPDYNITIEYERWDGTNREKGRLDPLVIEAANLTEAITSQQVTDALNRLDARMVDKEVDALPPEVALEAVASSAYLSSVQIYGEVSIPHG